MSQAVETPIVRKYGFVRDTYDHRDHHFSVPRPGTVAIPQNFSLRKYNPPIFDQGQLGSCTGNGIARALQVAMVLKKMQAVRPSRLKIYFDERDAEGTVSQDAGANIRDGIKLVSSLGYCPESMWPYDITKFAVKPPQECYIYGQAHKALSYQRVPQTLEGLQHAILSGCQIVYGFDVYKAFESAAVAKSGILTLPVKGEQSLGGHCVNASGWRTTSAGVEFECPNSWGPAWGLGGYFWTPASYLLNPQLASDFWIITGVE